MDWNQLFSVIVQLGIFSVFITSIIEVVKGVSAVGLRKLTAGLWNTLVHNKPMESESFPVLSFSIALLCCWAFNITIISYLFQNMLSLQLAKQTSTQLWFARYIDYFGTASMTYLGSDQLFKRFISVKEQAGQLLDTKNESKPAQ
jgi:hypothetical protein